MEGVLFYVNEYADLALSEAKKYSKNDERHKNLLTISERLRECPAKPAKNFMDALQCIHIMHCALHFTGEIVPIGRLDQLLNPYYLNDVKK